MNVEQPQQIKVATNVKHLLRLVVSTQETSAPFNQFTRPIARLRKVTTLSFFNKNLKSSEIEILEANGNPLLFLKKLRKILLTEKIDLVHLHSVHVAFFYLVVGMTLLFRGVPPAVFTVHCSYRTFNLRNKFLFLLAAPFANRVVFCSKASLDSFPSFYRLLCGKKITYITNGVDVERVYSSLAAEESARSIKFRICAVGLAREKNPLCLLRAFSRIATSDTELVILGDGPLREVVEQERIRLGLENSVELKGMVPREEVYREFSRSSLFVSASSSEGLPIAPLEAMLCQCAAVLSDIPAHLELIKDSKAIAVFNEGDDLQLASEMMKIKMLSISQQRDLGLAAKQHVAKHFQLSQMLNSYENLYSEVVAQKQ